MYVYWFWQGGGVGGGMEREKLDGERNIDQLLQPFGMLVYQDGTPANWATGKGKYSTYL